MSDEGNLTVEFDKSRGDALVIAPCNVIGQGTAIGPVFKVLRGGSPQASDQEKPEEYDIGVAAFDKLDENEQKAVRDHFVAKQMSALEESHANVVAKYERHLWKEVQSFEELVERHSAVIVPKYPDIDLRSQISDLKVESAEGDTPELLKEALKVLQSNNAKFMMLNDKSVFGSMQAYMGVGHHADVAVEKGFDDIISIFNSMNDEYQSERAADIEDIKHEIVADLRGLSSDGLSHVPDGAVLVMDHVPSTIDMADLRDSNTHMGRVQGILSTGKSKSAHAFLIAQSMGIVVGLIDDEFLGNAKDGDDCIVSGLDNLALLQPNKKALEHYGGLRGDQKKVRKALEAESRKRKSAKTLDGEKVNVHCNYAEVSDDVLHAANPVGYGLVRSETLFDDDKSVSDLSEVTEDQWYEKFKSVITQTGSDKKPYMKTVFRTIDACGDKVQKAGDVQRSDAEREEYEAPIRYRQNTALLKLKHELSQPHDNGKSYGHLMDVISPMITSTSHLKEHQKVMDEVAQDRGVDSIHLGAMVEVPSYAFGLQKPHAKVLSIGSNDLSSNIHAQNRFEEESDLTDPAFIKALQATIDAGLENDIPVSLCGAMASDPKMAAILVGVGLRNFSCDVQKAPAIKEIINRIDTAEAEALVDELLDIEDKDERLKRLYDFNEERLGLHLDRPLDLDWVPPNDFKGSSLDSEQRNG